MIQHAACVITNHSLAMHLADSFRRPTVVLFAGTDPEAVWRPVLGAACESTWTGTDPAFTSRARRLIGAAAIVGLAAACVGVDDEATRSLADGIVAANSALGLLDGVAVADDWWTGLGRLVDQRGRAVHTHRARVRRHLAGPAAARAALLVAQHLGPLWVPADRGDPPGHAVHVGLHPDLPPPGTEPQAVWVHAAGGDVVGHLSPDVSAWLRRADLLVHPTRWEGFGLALLEAMLASLPVVATRVSSIPEIVLDGETGFLVPADDVSALAEAVSRVLDDPAELGVIGRERARAEFSVARMVDRTLEVYRRATAA